MNRKTEKYEKRKGSRNFRDSFELCEWHFKLNRDYRIMEIQGENCEKIKILVIIEKDFLMYSD